MQIIIHACPQRMWYVDGLLVPELKAQGIVDSEIDVRCDTDLRGNLNSCMRIFDSCRGKPGGAWHLQDDVWPSADFAEKARQYDFGLVCGYCNVEFGPKWDLWGDVMPKMSWNSFPCIRIPHELAAECAAWFYGDARHRPELQSWVQTGKRDDSFFHLFLEEQKSIKNAYNLRPNIVEHVDWLMGGSIVNKWRGKPSRAAFWADDQRIEDLKVRIDEVQNARKG